MQNHLTNVYLGISHQSLDGNLLRVKGMIGELHRKKYSLSIVTVKLKEYLKLKFIDLFILFYYSID